MNRWRTRHPQWDGKAVKKVPDNDSGSTDTELTSSAEDIYAVAESYRDAVKKKDAAAKARKRSARR